MPDSPRVGSPQASPVIARRAVASRALSPLGAAVLGLALVVAPACKKNVGTSGGQAQSQDKGQELGPKLARYQVPLHEDEIALGGQEPLVTVVVYSNYACDPCRRTWWVLKHLLKVYGDRLRVVHRSVTIPGYRGNDDAVDASLAARAQDQFWPMHWRLFEHAQDLSMPVLKAHAKALKLDMERFNEAMETGAFSARRLRDARSQKLLGVSAGPMSFVNGVLVVGYRSEEVWHELIDLEMKRAKAQLARGVKPADLYGAMQANARKGPIRLDDATAKKMPDPAAKPKLPGEDTPLQEPDARRRYEVRAKDPQGTGPLDAPVVVVEFLDFQCPFCKAGNAEVFAQLRKQYQGKLRWEIRHLPLPSHLSAKGAAQAAWAAAQQGKFWDFHDALLAGTGSLGQRRFEAIARDLGLDLAKFRAQAQDPKAKAAVALDQAFAAALGVNATPSLFINGRYVSGLQPLGVYQGLIDEELQAASKAPGGPQSFYSQRLEDAVKRADFPNPWPEHIHPAPKDE